MLCPHCNKELPAGSSRCENCNNTENISQNKSKKTVWCSIFSLVIAFAALLLGAISVLAIYNREELSDITDRDIISSLVTYASVSAVSLMLSYRAIRKRYTAWRLCIVSLLILALSAFVTIRVLYLYYL